MLASRGIPSTHNGYGLGRSNGGRPFGCSLVPRPAHCFRLHERMGWVGGGGGGGGGGVCSWLNNT